MGGRVQTRLERDHVKRQQDPRKQRESRVQTRWERDHVKRQQEPSEQRELKPGEKELVSSCLLTLSLSCLVWLCEEATRNQWAGKARLQSRHIAWEGNENYNITGYIHHSKAPRHLQNWAFAPSNIQRAYTTGTKANITQIINRTETISSF